MEMSTSSKNITLGASDAQVWHQLKHVIANSSGFDRWQRSRNAEMSKAIGDRTLDDRVRRYLRETLETLAY